jgi:DNA-binding transcriptional LysR family regulator
VDAVNAVLGHRNDFHPETSTRSFRVAWRTSASWCCCRCCGSACTIAPGVCIEVLPLTAETGELLSAGKVDFALGVMPQLVTGIYQKVLFQQNFVCLVGKHHPRIGEQLTMADYESESHAVVSWSGQASAIVDREIARLGIKRRVALQIPNFLGAAFVAEYTDLVLTVPKRLATCFPSGRRYDPARALRRPRLRCEVALARTPAQRRGTAGCGG